MKKYVPLLLSSVLAFTSIQSFTVFAEGEDDGNIEEISEEGEEKLKSVMYHLVDNLRKIAILIRPFMEITSNKMFEQLKISPKNLTLYNTAFSHSSYANEHKAKKDYERFCLCYV